MGGRKDYTKRVFEFCVMVILMLVIVSFVPPFKAGGVSFKRANILSDLISFDDGITDIPSGESLLDTSFLEIFKGIDERIENSGPGKESAQETPELSSETGEARPAEPSPGASSLRTGAPANVIRAEVARPDIVNIEDFSEGEAMMSRFYHSLAYQTPVRPVRIAVLGDSFIEADIITADLREQLQMKYGGSGVGFVPFSTPLSKYRGTVKHTHEGWENYNVIQHKTVPEEYKPWFFVSGTISVPREGATTEYKGVRFRNRIENTNTASLLFVNRGTSSLRVTINDSLTDYYSTPGSDDVRCISIRRPGINKLDIKVTEAKGFIGYGVVMEDSIGVSVHNFSVRSNSGMALFGTDYRVNRQIDDLMNYDLVILQYGLNAMSADVTNYSYYGRQLCRIIEYVKSCFPRSAILVMSVGDRSSVKGGTATTMPAVQAMIKAQRDAALTSGVAFWNTFDAMGGNNSMPEFVKRKWASKDYTHIGYPGGKYIAERLVAYLNAAVESIKSQTPVPPMQPILESIHTETSGAAGGISIPQTVINRPGAATAPLSGGMLSAEDNAPEGETPGQRLAEPSDGPGVAEGTAAPEEAASLNAADEQSPNDLLELSASTKPETGNGTSAGPPATDSIEVITPLETLQQ